MNWENLHTAIREGASVFDYLLVNNIGLDRLDKFTIEDRTDSDHQPINATFKVTYRREVGEENFPTTKEKVIEI